MQAADVCNVAPHRPVPGALRHGLHTERQRAERVAGKGLRLEHAHAGAARVHLHMPGTCQLHKVHTHGPHSS
jgi:hypothetical protein